MGARSPDRELVAGEVSGRPLPHRPVDRFDPGWLFLLAGLVILVYTVVIPAQADLAEARWQRDRALAIEAQREERLFKHQRYLAAIESREPAVVKALAASQLNLVPVSQGAIVEVEDPATGDVSVFPSLEPAPIRLPELRVVESRLARWARDDKARLWLIIGGSVSVFIGLMSWNGRPVRE